MEPFTAGVFVTVPMLSISEQRSNMVTREIWRLGQNMVTREWSFGHNTYSTNNHLTRSWQGLCHTSDPSMVSSCKRDFEEILQTLFSIFLAIADEQTTHLETILRHKCFWFLGLWRWKRGRLARLLHWLGQGGGRNRLLGQGGGRQLLQNWCTIALGDRGEGRWRRLNITINNYCL